MSTATQETFAIVVMVLSMLVVGLLVVVKQRREGGKTHEHQERVQHPLPHALDPYMVQVVRLLRLLTGDPKLQNAVVTIERGRIVKIEVTP